MKVFKHNCDKMLKDFNRDNIAKKIIKPGLHWISSENEDNSSKAKLIKIKTQ